ncbi:N-acetyllactosaminide beta-1,3-N-acetylglucosaminyltransferase 4-like [Zootoca vivipara]|uniref:N-acetyllactosaminide beta-1,3-N-acetylglucosaminyltransferase 4-like n=1 Tax=Zootoca vivipara TaxID=8524 RepID=UPI0015917C34|nr:N-acetyllactosaminide beta-1,3-N-acetylglucosaminyltransferase 4-like [Zootoca vivipara]
MRRTHLLCTVILGGVLTLAALHWHLARMEPQWVPEPCPCCATFQPPALANGTTLSDGTFTYHLNLDIYNDLFPELQRYQCRELTCEQGWCREASAAPLLLLAIKSHPGSSTRRAALRRTWARPREVGGFRLRHVFLMAMSPSQKQMNLAMEENDEFGDILMWDFTESHHNLSLKERCFLQWVHTSCPGVAYIFKGDDDLFVNLPALAEYLAQTPNASRFIHGNIQLHSAVMRVGKYGVSTALYPQRYYPNFASGGGFVVPGPLIPALHQASLELPVFPLDDVYMAFLTLAAGIPHRHDKRFKVWGIPKDDIALYREALTVHGISTERMEEVWQELRVS